MRDFVETKGIVLNCSNYGEYDKRLVILTTDNGKVTVFVRSARKQNSKFLAACSPLCYGNIKLFPGKEAYTLMDFEVKNYFEKLRTDLDISCMAMYFLEIADYYCCENNDEKEMLKLLYVALCALEKAALGQDGFRASLIRIIYEIKAIAVNGEFPGIPEKIFLSPSASYAINFIASSVCEKVFNFTVTAEVEAEMNKAAIKYRQDFLKGNFKSLQLL